jgi:hypothetical protein
MSTPHWINRMQPADVDPLLLRPHAANFRLHPAVQREATASSLDLVGFVDSIVVSRRTNTILNGHLRVELAIEAGIPTVPVVFVDVDQADEALIVATFDRLGALAPVDGSKLHELLSEAAPLHGSVQGLLDDWLNEYTLTPQAAFDGVADVAPETHMALVVSIGAYRQEVPLLAYRAWVEALRADVGDDKGAIHAELLRRLGIEDTN